MSNWWDKENEKQKGIPLSRVPEWSTTNLSEFTTDNDLCAVNHKLNCRLEELIIAYDAVKKWADTLEYEVGELNFEMSARAAEEAALLDAKAIQAAMYAVAEVEPETPPAMYITKAALRRQVEHLMMEGKVTIRHSVLAILKDESISEEQCVFIQEEQND